MYYDFIIFSIQKYNKSLNNNNIVEELSMDNDIIALDNIEKGHDFVHFN